ncbi:hypothetical protein BDK51DRAFT_38871 [Blyttiomyces helicus]|uniref:Uncharacterized protein n=1 Tax=Blyttiomyces helicus TaxID=388810 RepID=A0A4P9WJR0_9FUNG|nr:hypothetical protein BDK51DRAFT_38871 [Blyttiomyces helicus]|eukprot:RKO92305.1 hypothetical protein BDK51DRAFT_38871 [Blyttiomyces helicus]
MRAIPDNLRPPRPHNQAIWAIFAAFAPATTRARAFDHKNDPRYASFQTGPPGHGAHHQHNNKAPAAHTTIKPNPKSITKARTIHGTPASLRVDSPKVQRVLGTPLSECDPGLWERSDYRCRLGPEGWDVYAKTGYQPITWMLKRLLWTQSACEKERRLKMEKWGRDLRAIRRRRIQEVALEKPPQLRLDLFNEVDDEDSSTSTTTSTSQPTGSYPLAPSSTPISQLTLPRPVSHPSSLPIGDPEVLAAKADTFVAGAFSWRAGDPQNNRVGGGVEWGKEVEGVRG